jgi:predicted alpha/beta hydrolase family esterase
VLVLPGWENSGPTHWQSLWEQQHGDERVEQDDWSWPKRGDWMTRLEETLLASDTPALLVAHSLGCHLVAAWASHSQHLGRVRAALLVAPPDLTRENLPPQLTTWRSTARQALPFPTITVFSEDDPYASVEASRAMAAAWGSEVISVGARGHINGDSGLHDWPEGRQLLLRLAGVAR